MQLDVRTMLLAIAVSNLLMAAGFLIVSRRGRPVAGGREWVWGNLLLFAGWALLDLRGAIPLLFSLALGNVLLSGGLLLELRAIAAFRGVTLSARLVYTVFAVYAALLFTMLPLHASGALFITITCLFNAGTAAATARYAWPARGARDRSAEMLTGVSFALSALVLLLRAVDTASNNPARSLLTADGVQSVFFAWLYISIISSAFGFILMAKEEGDRELERMALTDALTGVRNRRAFMQRAHAETGRCARTLRPVCVLMMDLDHFKSINDTLGHDGGDDVLRHFASAAQNALRPYDVLGRYGGEEFAAVLPETSAEQGMQIAQRVRNCCDARYTVSIGLAAGEPGELLEALLKRADLALYGAKSAGRNRVVAASPLTASAGRL